MASLGGEYDCYKERDPIYAQSDNNTRKRGVYRERQVDGEEHPLVSSGHQPQFTSHLVAQRSADQTHGHVIADSAPIRAATPASLHFASSAVALWHTRIRYVFCLMLSISFLHRV